MTHIINLGWDIFHLIWQEGHNILHHIVSSWKPYHIIMAVVQIFEDKAIHNVGV
jgi:hypothetical protein